MDKETYYAETLKVARNLRKLTQKELAALIGVTVGTVSQWECGLRVPQLRHRRMLADALGEFRLLEERDQA